MTDSTDAVRLEIRVRPGASRTAVAGSYGGAVVVRVSARAVDGRATEAALAALAEAFDVRRRNVRLIIGTTSRDKVVEIVGRRSDIEARLAELKGE